MSHIQEIESGAQIESKLMTVPSPVNEPKLKIESRLDE